MSRTCLYDDCCRAFFSSLTMIIVRNEEPPRDAVDMAAQVQLNQGDKEHADIVFENGGATSMSI